MNEPKYKTDQKPRITIYCNDEEQKNRISARLETVKNKYMCKNNSDTLDYILKKIIEGRLKIQ